MYSKQPQTVMYLYSTGGAIHITYIEATWYIQYQDSAAIYLQVSIWYYMNDEYCTPSARALFLLHPLAGTQ